MKPTLILVDDSELARADMRRALEQDFEIVGECADGLAAVEMAREMAPQMILMDVVLPRLSGIDATRIILQQATTPPRIVMISALGDETLALQAFEAGACDYVVKPAKTEQLKEALWGILKAAA